MLLKLFHKIQRREMFQNQDCTRKQQKKIYMPTSFMKSEAKIHNNIMTNHIQIKRSNSMIKLVSIQDARMVQCKQINKFSAINEQNKG
jgi:hypothetical protein